jgi:hypothetical protein
VVGVKKHINENAGHRRSMMEMEIMNRKSEFNDDRQYFEQMHNNKQIGSESSAKWLWTWQVW